MKNTLSLVLILLSIFSLAQLKPVKWYYDKEQKILKAEGFIHNYGFSEYKYGKWKNYYSNGNVESTGEYKKNDEIGIWEYYTEDGFLYKKKDYTNGIYTNYSLDRETIEELSFLYRQDGVLYLKSYKKYSTNGQTYIEGNFNADEYIISNTGWVYPYVYYLPKGIWKTYWENGKLATEYNFDTGGIKFINKEYTNKYEYGDGGYGKGEKVLTEINYSKNDDNRPYFKIEGLGFDDSNSSSRKIKLDYIKMPINENSFCRVGLWEYWNEKGILQSKTEYSPYTNKPVGKHESFFPSGKIKTTGYYSKDSKQTGIWKYYYENGILAEERLYENGELNGLNTNYFENGKIKEKTSFINNKVEGIREYYHPNGKLLGKETYQNHNITNYGDFFDENGSPILQSGTGYIIHYNDKGIITYKGNYVNQQKEGLSEWFYDNSKLEESFNYKKGIRNGVNKIYFQNGNLMQKGNYDNDVLNGEIEYYHPNGKIAGKQKYTNGTFIELLDCYDENGNITLKNGTGSSISYYNNGNIESIINYKNHCRDGKAEWFYDNGKLEQSAIYKYSENNKPFGLRWEILESYSKDGKQRYAGTLKDGNGEWVTYDQNNKPTVKLYENGIQIEQK